MRSFGFTRVFLTDTETSRWKVTRFRVLLVSVLSDSVNSKIRIIIRGTMAALVDYCAPRLLAVLCWTALLSGGAGKQSAFTPQHPL